MGRIGEQVIGGIRSKGRPRLVNRERGKPQLRWKDDIKTIERL